jgi:hypothetical protein
MIVRWRPDRLVGTLSARSVNTESRRLVRVSGLSFIR